jgi:hypothetical protein
MVGWVRLICWLQEPVCTACKLMMVAWQPSHILPAMWSAWVQMNVSVCGNGSRDICLTRYKWLVLSQSYICIVFLFWLFISWWIVCVQLSAVHAIWYSDFLFGVKFDDVPDDIHSLYIWKISILEKCIAMQLVSPLKLSSWPVFSYSGATTIF